MRTTVTLEPDLALQLKQRMRQRKIPFKQALNEVLRTGLAVDHRRPTPRFRVEPHSFRFRPGIDLDKLNQLADELEAEETRGGLAR